MIEPRKNTDRPAATVRVVVVGSANLDLIARVNRLPVPGETILADAYVEAAGGKGLNQAMAAARRTSTALVAAVGSDSAGRALRHAAESHGVDASLLATVDAPSGRALISVDSDAENTIVVVSGANRSLTSSHVISSLERTRPAIVLAQSEISTSVVAATAEWCSANKIRFAWNCSPVGNSDLNALKHADPLVTNRTEAFDILETLHIPASTPTEALAALARLCRSVVITLGAQGAIAFAAGSRARVGGRPVSTAADTTGAGDEFAGALVGALASGSDFGDALELATNAATELISKARHDR